MHRSPEIAGFDVAKLLSPNGVVFGQDIQAYREQAKLQAEQILQQSLQQLHEGGCAEAVMAELTRKLTQTLTHAPSKLLRQTASEQPPDTVAFVSDSLTHAYRPKHFIPPVH